MLSFPEVLSELERLCAERRTGFVLVRPSGAKLARITLEDGEIVFVSYQDRTGVEALDLLSGLDSAQLDFIEGLGGTAKADLPSTAEILAALAGARSPGGVHPGTPPAASVRSRAGAIDARSRSILEATLADYIGPMASMVCEGDLVGTQSLEAAITALAKEIPDPENGRRFVADVRAKLA